MTRDFLEAVAGYGIEKPPTAAAQRGPKLAAVADDYSGTGAAAVVFDGESVAGLRTYVALQPVVAEQRVVMLPVGHTYVILGDLEAGLADELAAIATLAGDNDARLDDLTADTGWVTLTLVAGWTQGSTPIAARRVGNLVTVSGFAQRSSWSSGQDIATLPVQFRPDRRTITNTNTAFGQDRQIDIEADGVMDLVGTGTGGIAIHVTYPVTP